VTPFLEQPDYLSKLCDFSSHGVTFEMLLFGKDKDKEKYEYDSR